MLKLHQRPASRFGILALSLLAASAVLSCKEGGKDPSPESQPARPPKPGYIRIADAKAAYDGGAQFFDARMKADYDSGHIKGAFLIDPTDDKIISSETTPEPLKKFHQAAPVVVYCGGGDCDASEFVAILLRKFGFKSVKVFEEGFSAWKARGYPVGPG
jgi:rhodanese-related sulfurtransferase